MFGLFTASRIHALNVRGRRDVRFRATGGRLNLLQFPGIEEHAPASGALVDFHSSSVLDRLERFRTPMLRIGTSIRIRGGQGEFATRAIHARHDTRAVDEREGKCASPLRTRKRLE